MSSTSNKINYVKQDLPSKVNKVGLALFIIGLIWVAGSYFADPVRSAFNNIVMFMFVMSIGIGSLFLVGLEYLSGAVWSTPFRRVSEFLGGLIIVLPLIALPLFFNLHDLFHWTHEEAVAGDKILQGKSPYLNIQFFIIRFAATMLIWLLFYYLIIKNSRNQDKNGEQKFTTKNIKLSAIFMPFFAVTVTFSAIDWLMSLEPHWFSTIFGVYYFSGTVLASLAAAAYIIIQLNERGYFVKGLGKDHYYSIGALLFAFTNFWAYIAFSQFLLIWYANLPEETYWFLDRWHGSWMFVTIGVAVIRFAVPYFMLLSQPSKMDPKRLKFAAVWILAAHFFDLYWLVMPTFSKDGAPLSWNELGFPVLAVGIIILVFVRKYKKANLVPIGDPKLKRGIDFRL